MKYNFLILLKEVLLYLLIVFEFVWCVLGYNKIFDQTTNPIGGWLNSYTDSSKVQVAPQETEISSYKIGARDTEIDEEAFEDFDL